jgi:hypothetical protein
VLGPDNGDADMEQQPAIGIAVSFEKWPGVEAVALDGPRARRFAFKEIGCVLADNRNP